MDAAVVVLNWNKAALTRRSILAARQATTEPVHWIVVDNGSTDPIGDLGPDVTLIRNAKNLGFAGGVNVGLRCAFAAGAKHAWLLNNDAEPLPGALAALLARARSDPAIGLASAVILNADADDALEWVGSLWRDGIYRTTTEPAEYARWAANLPEYLCLVGTALLVSQRLVEHIGYFDDAFFAYWEDIDFSRRSAAAGFRNVVVEEAIVRHHCGRPAERPEERPPYYFYFMTRNEIFILRKAGYLLKTRHFYWLINRILRTLKLLRKLPAQRQAVYRGTLDGFLGRGGPYLG